MRPHTNDDTIKLTIDVSYMYELGDKIYFNFFFLIIFIASEGR